MEAQKAQGFVALAILLFITPVEVSSFIFCTVFQGSDTYLRMGKMLPILEFQLLINICKECTCRVYYVCPSVLLCIRKAEPKNLFIRQVFTLFRGHEGPQGEYRYRSTLYRTSALDWGVSPTPRPSVHPLPRKERVLILQEAGQAPGPVWTGVKSLTHRDQIPDRPALSQSLHQLSYPAHTCFTNISNLKFPEKVPKQYNINTNQTKKKDTLHGDLLVLLYEFREQ